MYEFMLYVCEVNCLYVIQFNTVSFYCGSGTCKVSTNETEKSNCEQSSIVLGILYPSYPTSA